ncbi:tetratricopeptide repeat protein [Acetobacterium woodii]|uniref:Sel1-like protein n=1 Tax=Acetobacterium woodii (strain ATCC 29683 / DSM 1030 / JCM 2381 / KCTC 1655 / WB1) TaxID=931626 RepID=H6LHI1_ACEWD|nr:tetratricopeptide repeat protein [Acetobacterium woodii]AFA49691.1 Sel1-like protein [Acetobacterium woodii DSM 1030]
MKNWSHLPSGEIELTIESEAYLELAKDYFSKCQYEDARQALEVAVRSANPQAEYLFGVLYEDALGVDWNEDKALLWYLRAADHGYAPAQTAAACLYLDEDDVMTDYAEAYRLLTLAVHKENADENDGAPSLSVDFPDAAECFDEDERWIAVQEGYAEYRLGWMHVAGLGVDIDKEKAFSWMEKAAKKRFRAAVFELAQRSEYGIERNEVWAKKAVEYGEYDPLIRVALRYLDNDDTPEDIEKGLSTLTELADKGIGSAQIALAECLIKGKSTSKDADKALQYLSLAAKMGDAKLITGLGIALYKSEETEIDPDVAVKCLELAAAAGDNEALVELGNLYFDGAGEILPDQEKAFRYFIQAAEKDVPSGCELAGYCLYEGKGVLQNRQEALGWYEKAAEQGFYNSYYMIGMIYGYDETLFNYEKAVRCFEKSAKLGQTDALIRLGTMHLHGVGAIPSDRRKAFHYFIEAAQADNNLGWEWAAYCYYWGYGTQQNKQKALQFYHKAAQKGSGHSQYMLGYIYGYDTTPPDFKKAARWFKKAARQGHSDAQLKLGFYYYHGRGVKQNYKTAFKLFTQAAAQGQATAMYNIGDAYENGYGVEKDEKQAFAWYRKSAELGDKWGMFGAGRLLFYGIGTPLNQEEGQCWINKAAKAGLPEAIKWRTH